LDRRAQGIERVRKLDEHGVSGRVDDAAVMRLRQATNLAPTRLQRPNGPEIILGHEPAVTGGVGAQERCKPPRQTVSLSVATHGCFGSTPGGLPTGVERWPRTHIFQTRKRTDEQ